MAQNVTASEQIQTICKQFVLTDPVLEDIMIQFLHALVMGLGKATHPKSIVKCFITYVQELPDGTEVGSFLALDLGGTNFRVLCIHLDKSKFDMESKTYSIPEEVKTGTAVELFDLVADCLADFCKEKNLLEKKLPLGFTFSFPCRQEGLCSAILERWTKGFNVKDTVGKDIGKLLRDAIQRKNEVQIDVVAILNDTTGTLMSCAWKDPSCRIGLIIGTGSNACFVERVERAECFKGKTEKPYVIINAECGAFGDDGALDFIRTEFDRQVDATSLNPGKQIQEKMIAGMYMGELVRLIMVKCIQQKLLFNGESCDVLKQYMEFKTEYVSQIESGSNLNSCRSVLDSIGMKNATNEDLVNVRFICECVSTRAAYLASASMATMCNRMGFKDVTIAVDGTLYRLHPKLHDLMTEKIQQLVKPEIKIKLMLSNDGSGRGAALVAAVASRDKTTPSTSSI